jgi:hypothetical protein
MDTKCKLCKVALDEVETIVQKYKEEQFEKDLPKINKFMDDVINIISSEDCEIIGLCLSKQCYLHSDFSNKEIYERIFGKIDYDLWKKFTISPELITIPTNHFGSTHHRIELRSLTDPKCVLLYDNF